MISYLTVLSRLRLLPIRMKGSTKYNATRPETNAKEAAGAVVGVESTGAEEDSEGTVADGDVVNEAVACNLDLAEMKNPPSWFTSGNRS